MEETIECKTKKKADKSGAFVLALVSSFLLTVYAPLETYFTNKNEFWFDFFDIVGAELIGFLAIFGVLFGGLLLARKIHEKCYRFFYLLGSICLLEVYLEGTFFVKGLPLLDGRRIDWSQYASRRILTISAFLVITVAMGIALWKLAFPKLEEIVKIGFSLLGAVLFVTLLSLMVMNNGLERKEIMVINKNNEFDYSTTQNLAILIIDSVEAGLFNEVLEKHPEYRETLKDFTYYSDMLATYTQTAYSVGYIMTGGQWYEDQKEDYEDYINRGYASSPFLDKLEQQGFRIGMYIMEFMPQKCDRIFRFDNVKKCPPFHVDLLNYWKVQGKVVGIRYAPFELKRFCNVDTKDFISSRKDTQNADIYSDNNRDFYLDLKKREIQKTSDRIFKLLHIEGAHVPFNYDKDVNYTENGTFETSTEATFTIVSTWLEKLQEAGVYDNSALIIMADHGLSLTDDPKGRQHPVFFVKGMNEHADSLRISDAPVSFEDLQTAFDRLMAGADGQSIFDWKEGDKRDRKCYFLSYPELMRNLECIEHGKAGDISALEVLDY